MNHSVAAEIQYLIFNPELCFRKWPQMCTFSNHLTIIINISTRHVHMLMGCKIQTFPVLYDTMLDRTPIHTIDPPEEHQ